MPQKIVVHEADFLSVEFALCDTVVKAVLSFQIKNENDTIVNIGLDNNNMKDLFNGFLTAYADIGCPTATLFKKFLEDQTNEPD